MNPKNKVSTQKDKKPRIYTISFASVYPLYIQKVERKGRTKSEVDKVIFWLTGYNKAGLKKQLDQNHDFATFFKLAPQINKKASLIKGTICGYRIEDIEDKLMRNIRYLDKLIDELAKGKTLEKVLMIES